MVTRIQVDLAYRRWQSAIKERAALKRGLNWLPTTGKIMEDLCRETYEEFKELKKEYEESLTEED